MGCLGKQKRIPDSGEFTFFGEFIFLNLLLMLDTSSFSDRHYTSQGQIDVMSDTSVHPFSDFLLL